MIFSVYSLCLKVQSTQTWSIYGFCIRNRDYDLRCILHIWVLGPLGYDWVVWTLGVAPCCEEPGTPWVLVRPLVRLGDRTVDEQDPGPRSRS